MLTSHFLRFFKKIYGISHFIQSSRTPQGAWNWYAYDNLFGKLGDHEAGKNTGNI